MLSQVTREIPWRRNLLKLNDLKGRIHQRNLTQLERLLLVLASFDVPCEISEIKQRASEAGLRIPKKWNPSSVLARSKGLAIKTVEGWEITPKGRHCLAKLGVDDSHALEPPRSISLREELKKVLDGKTHSFLDEAIKCYEARLFRAAVILSWIGAISVLQHHVCSRHLLRFNEESKRVNPKWKDAQTTDDLSLMKESEFLDRLESISIIGRDVKTQLKECLTRRNSCSHPNSYQLGSSTVAHHREVLLLNVFRVFVK